MSEYTIFQADELAFEPRGEDDPPERHEIARGGVLVVQPGTILQLRNAGVAIEAVCVLVHLDASKVRSAPLPDAVRARLG